MWLAALVVLLLVALPPFVCMELHMDPLLFDTYARTLQRGGVMYRDSCEVNLPGMTWLHWGIRSTLGWRSETLRAVDLLVMGSVVVLLVCWFPGLAASWRFGLAIALVVFYVTRSEWCHVQRDPWMLLPALGALYLRRGRRLPFVEGMLWAIAFWIKPYVAVPVMCVWLTSAWLDRRDGVSVSRLLVDVAALLAGGATVGALGIAWMVRSGAWPYFVETVKVWSPEYYQFDESEGMPFYRFAGVCVRFFPWIFIHLIAVPAAIQSLRRADQSGRLMAALYLGWLFQTIVLQHNLFDYIQSPAILLGVAVVVGQTGRESNSALRRLMVAFVGVCVLACVPVLARRLEVWPRCWREGSSAELRDRLSVLRKVNWQALERSANYLRSRQVSDGEVSCFSIVTSPLYRELDVEAPTRFHYLQNDWRAFRRQRPSILADLAASRQRFVVVDLAWHGIEVNLEQLDEPSEPPLPPSWERWKSQIVYRAERYAVLEIPAAEMPAWMTECFSD